MCNCVKLKGPMRAGLSRQLREKHKMESSGEKCGKRERIGYPGFDKAKSWWSFRCWLDLNEG